MAKMKCLLLYFDDFPMFEVTDDADFGKAIKTLMMEARGQETRPLDNAPQMMIYQYLKSRLSKDEEKWNETCKRRSEAGKRAMEKRWSKQEEQQPTPKQEQAKQEDSPTVYEVPLNNGTGYPVTERDMQEYRELYPAADVDLEIKKMIRWCNDNKTRRKTKNGIARFISSWLAKAHDEGSRKPQPAQQQPKQDEFIPKEGENPFAAYIEWESRKQ